MLHTYYDWGKKSCLDSGEFKGIFSMIGILNNGVFWAHPIFRPPKTKLVHKTMLWATVLIRIQIIPALYMIWCIQTEKNQTL